MTRQSSASIVAASVVGLLCVSVYVVGVQGCSATRAAPDMAAPSTQPLVNTVEMVIAPDSVANRLLLDVQRANPRIGVELRYATSGNFMGAPLPGYRANRASLRREAALALGRVEERAEREGLRLHVFDAYRPARATAAMVAWTERAGRTDLLRDGYIASRSRHNLGLAVDLTLIDVAAAAPLDMGTAFDTFSPSAHTANAVGTALANRLRLDRLMRAEGFANYDQEWWHFTYSLPDPVRFDREIE